MPVDALSTAFSHLPINWRTAQCSKTQFLPGRFHGLLLTLPAGPAIRALAALALFDA
jgi:hypothetical protein